MEEHVPSLHASHAEGHRSPRCQCMLLKCKPSCLTCRVGYRFRETAQKDAHPHAREMKVAVPSSVQDLEAKAGSESPSTLSTQVMQTEIMFPDISPRCGSFCEFTLPRNATKAIIHLKEFGGSELGCTTGSDSPTLICPALWVMF